MFKNTIKLILFCLLVFGCKKKDSAIRRFHPIPQGLKDFFNYQAGSYWVFKNSVSGGLDSLYVRNYLHSAEIDNSLDSVEAVEIQFVEYLDVNYPDMRDVWDLNIRYQAGIYYTELEEGKPCPDFTYNWPFDINRRPDSVQKAFYPEMTVNGKTYKDVYWYHRTYDGDGFYDLYFNADSGFIKTSSRDILGEMELARCNILR